MQMSCEERIRETLLGSNKALDNHSLSDTAVWCHFCLLGGKRRGGRGGGAWAEWDARFKTGRGWFCDGNTLEHVSYWDAMATEAHVLFIIFLLNGSRALIPSRPRSHCTLLPAFSCFSFTSSTPTPPLPTFILAPSRQPLSSSRLPLLPSAWYWLEDEPLISLRSLGTLN